MAPLDFFVGRRLKDRRTELGTAIETVAIALGTTIDEYSEYETGHSRIPAVRLVRLARILDVTVSYFFNGGDAHVKTLPSQHEVARLTAIFCNIESKEIREYLLELSASFVHQSGPHFERSSAH